MYWITGDIHGNQILWNDYINPFMRKEDTIIIVGDFGVGFFDGKYWPEEMFYDFIANQDYTVLFCDGNHENFSKLNSYPVSDWNGGKAHIVRRNLIHLIRGEIYDIDVGSEAGKRSIWVFGGGYSVDKALRDESCWWPEEMPNEEEYENGRNHLKEHDYKVDYILTHTAPIDTVNYMSHISKAINYVCYEESELTSYLQWVEDVTEYRKWYFGHFHIDSELWKNQYVVFNAIRELSTGNLVKKHRKWLP